MECQLRAGEHNTIQLQVEGHVWAEMSTEWIVFSHDIDVPQFYELFSFASVT